MRYSTALLGHSAAARLVLLSVGSFHSGFCSGYGARSLLSARFVRSDFLCHQRRRLPRCARHAFLERCPSGIRSRRSIRLYGSVHDEIAGSGPGLMPAAFCGELQPVAGSLRLTRGRIEHQRAIPQPRRVEIKHRP